MLTRVYFNRLRRRNIGKATHDKQEQLPQADVKEHYNPSTDDSAQTLAHSLSSSTALRSGSSSWLDKVVTLKERSESQVSASDTEPIDSLGLNLLYTPLAGQTTDIVFIHGLGGTSQRSWCHNRDPQYFWPRNWLPLESEISGARLFSFGYNARVRNAGSGTVSAISDFAAQLLWDMKLGRDEDNKLFDMGKTPIILVAHSMGGLVAKKAMILGQSDDQYKHIVNAVRAMVFLATPHRGSDLATTLNRILSMSGQSNRIYISELMRNSTTLQDINHQFRNISGLTLASFYENRATSIGFKKEIIVQKDSATLGYAGEITRALDADHHGVIKFESRTHHNYKDVRNLLADLVVKFRVLPETKDMDTIRADLSKLTIVLGDVETPTADLEFFADRSIHGTGAWLIESLEFKNWLTSTSNTAQLLWLNGLPGTGKSTVTSAVIHHLRDNGSDITYFFFRFDDQNKRSSGFFLRSMAMQISMFAPKFRELLMHFAHKQVSLKISDSRQIWQKLFTVGLRMISKDRPIFWVVDALDEADQPSAVLEHLSSLCELTLPVRIFIASRDIPGVSNGVSKLARMHPCSTMSMEDHDTDLETYVHRELEDLRGHPSFREHVMNEVLKKSGGNFLWSVLVTYQIMQCDTEDEVDEVLRGLPSGLEPLYQRVENDLKRSLIRSKTKLAQEILTWTCCSRRALYMEELVVALGGDKSTFIDLNQTARKVCGDFVVVDKLERLTMTHHCAREYITKHASGDLLVNADKGHFVILKRCLTYLLSPDTKSLADAVNKPPFMEYAAASWPSHLDSMGHQMDRNTLDLLDTFFRSDMVLTWIQILAASDDLMTLVQAATVLNSYVNRQDRVDKSSGPPASARRVEQRDLLSRWAVDLVKIVGKFGMHLLRHPQSIHKHVVPFCPANSIIYQSYTHEGYETFSVRGFSSNDWDDNLAKFTVPQASSIACTEKLFAVRTRTGSVVLYDALTLTLSRILKNDQRILLTRFNATGTRMVCCGFDDAKVWDVTNGSLLHVVLNRDDRKAIACAFNADSDRVYVCCDDRSIRVAQLLTENTAWEIENWLYIDDIVDTQQYVKCPYRAEFNIDATLLAVSFQACPLLVWKVQPLRFLNRHVRQTDLLKKPGDNYTTVARIDWNQDNRSILGLYNDGAVFNWQPLKNECNELDLESSSRAVGIRCSPLGDILATNSKDGTIRVYALPGFALIYQLFCASPVSDLAISPDSRRVYDLREIYCSVWEPNVLIRLSESDEKCSDASSTLCDSRVASLNSEASMKLLEPVTSLTVGPLSYGYATGGEEGAVKVFDSVGNMIAEFPRVLFSVDHILWSDDEKILMTGNAAGRVRVKSLDKLDKEVRDELLLDKSVKGPISQILIHTGSKYVLVATPEATHVWNLSNGQECAHQLCDIAARWTNHPMYPNIILCFASDCVKFFNWANFECQGTVLYDDSLAVQARSADLDTWRKPSVTLPAWLRDNRIAVTNILRSCEGTQILLELSKASTHNKFKLHQEYKLLQTTQIRIGLDQASRTTSAIDESCTSIARLPSSPLATAMLECIEQPLGFIPGETLVFLDREYWTCSCFLGRQSTAVAGTKIKRHFPIPQDWLNDECLRLAIITTEGTLLLPRNGEVGVIKGGLRDEWFD